MQILAALCKAGNRAPELKRVGYSLYSSTAFHHVPLTPLRRHSLVWLSHAPQPALAGEATDVDQWHADGYPFVVCRQRDEGDLLSLGFCLPAPGRRPRRIGVNSRPVEILRVARPPWLKDVATGAFEPDTACRGGCANRPSGVQAVGTTASTINCRDQVAALIRLSDAAAKACLDVRVFGSWMWQALTGGLHVNESSDLDVLIDVSTASDAGRAADFLQGAAADCPFVVDGELSISGLGEFHWREYLKGEPEVLVKSVDAVRMLPREDLWK